MKKVFSLLTALVPFISFAHEGHGNTGGFTITHYMVEPQHAFAIVIGMVAMYIIYKSLNRKEQEV